MVRSFHQHRHPSERIAKKARLNENVIEPRCGGTILTLPTYRPCPRPSYRFAKVSLSATFSVQPLHTGFHFSIRSASSYLETPLLSGLGPFSSVMDHLMLRVIVRSLESATALSCEVVS